MAPNSSLVKVDASDISPAVMSATFSADVLAQAMLDGNISAGMLAIAAVCSNHDCPPGDVILQDNADTSVGQAVLQRAVEKGATVINIMPNR